MQNTTETASTHKSFSHALSSILAILILAIYGALAWTSSDMIGGWAIAITFAYLVTIAIALMTISTTRANKLLLAVSIPLPGIAILSAIALLLATPGN